MWRRYYKMLKMTWVDVSDGFKMESFRNYMEKYDIMDC